jgi:putative hydrolase of the HAD superfamily
VKAIILDMYGVIVKQTGDDFVPYVQKSFPNLAENEILAPWFEADAGKLTSLDVWKKLGFQGDLEKIEQEYLDTIELNDRFYKFADNVKGRCKLALISNDSSRWSRYLREKFKLNRYFDVISVSGDLKIQKPDKRIFELTLEKLGCKASDCIYVDDREGNLSAAQNLGMKPILFNSRNISYQGDTVANFEQLTYQLVDWIGK